MPIGHAMMVLNEMILEEHKFLGALILGFIGIYLLVYGVKNDSNKSIATILGLMGGILIWTGWIEFSFVWIAEKWSVPALMENGEIATRPEYLIMPSSIGLLGSFFLLFLFSYSKCQFFNWFQKLFGLKKHLKSKNTTEKPITIVTFIETIMVLWTFYIVLLLVYDNDIAGDNHPLTYIVAFGSLFWSIYLFQNLIKIQKFDYAIRYAVPTVIIFWNFVEVLGRWNLFKEIWVHPFEHWIEITIITILFFAFIVYYIIENRNTVAQDQKILM
jgi:hypothetical protein